MKFFSVSRACLVRWGVGLCIATVVGVLSPIDSSAGQPAGKEMSSDACWEAPKVPQNVPAAEQTKRIRRDSQGDSSGANRVGQSLKSGSNKGKTQQQAAPFKQAAPVRTGLSDASSSAPAVADDGPASGKQRVSIPPRPKNLPLDAAGGDAQ